MDTIRATLKQRGDTEANWLSVNPVLAKNEAGITTDGANKNRVKYGDGVNRWNSLSYSDQHVRSVLNTHDNNIQDIDANIDGINSKIENIENDISSQGNTLAGINTIPLHGMLLTRSINGFTQVQRLLLPQDAVFISGKTNINDVSGTQGVYVRDIDGATIEVVTVSVSPTGQETVQHPNVATHADLPLTVADAIALGWSTPVVGGYTTVDNDETMGNLPVEWYITKIDDNQNIIWGNPRILNLGDYQQSAPSDAAGKIGTIGEAPGTWGDFKSIDTTPVADSKNLISSGAVKEAVKESVADKLFMGVSTTGAAVTMKSVNIAGYTREVNSIISVLFTVTNTIATPTLNVNGLGAAQFRYNGAVAQYGHLRQNNLLILQWDGTYWQILKQNDFLEAHPIGSVYFTANTDENTITTMRNRYGGTWEATCKGRVPLGVGSNDANTDTTASEGGSFAAGQINKGSAGIKGGNKSHTLTETQAALRGHDHSVTISKRTIPGGTPDHDHAAAQSLNAIANGSGAYSTTYSQTIYTDPISGTTASEGHNNMMQYETYFMYKRTT